jgi:metal-responsive CopG/Arc/MetJ family transcriptional regulator
MARKKISDDKKKRKTVVTVNEKLLEKFDDFLDKNNINRSNYIEKLIEDDMKKRNQDFDKNF